MSSPFTAPGRTQKRLILLLLAVNLVLLLCYLVFDYRVLLDSQAAVKNLLAQEMLESGRLVPPGWRFADDDLWGLAGAWLVLPWLAVLPNGFAAHALGATLMAALVLSGTWCVTSILGQSRNVRLTVLLVLASGLSAGMAENLYGQQTWGAIYAATCFTLYASWRYYQADGHARFTWGIVGGLLLALAFFFNPQRALAMLCLPIGVSAIVMRWQALERRIGPLPPRRFAILGWLLTILAAALAGSGLHMLAVDGMLLPEAAPVTAWLDFDAMLGKLRAGLHGLFAIFGGLPQAGTPVASLLSLYQALRMLAVLVMLCMLPWALLRLLASRLSGRLYFGVFTLAALIPALFIQLATTSPQGGEVLYLLPSLLCLFMVLVTVVLEENHGWLSSALGKFVVLAMASSAIVTYSLPFAGAESQGSARARLGQFLQAEGLVMGFAGSELAGPLTVLSNHHVQARPVSWQGGQPMPVSTQASAAWYAPDGWQGSVFLVMSGAEAQQTDWNLLQEWAGKAPRRLNFEGWQIAVFDQHFARFLPSWNRDLAVPLRLPISKRSLHKIGSYVEASRSLKAEEGETGALHYGPYLALPAGRYVASFDIEASSDEALGFGSVEVASGHGATVHAKKSILAPGRHRETLSFTLEQDVRDLEFRVLSNGAGEVSLSGIETSRVQLLK